MKHILLAAVCAVCLGVMPSKAFSQHHIVMLGDSLTSGHGLENVNGSFPARLEARLQKEGVNVNITNAGISGNTTADGLQRVQQALDQSPDLLIVALGGNDLLRKVPVKETRKNLTAIVDAAQKQSVPVLIFGLKAPYAMGPSYVWSFNGVFEDVADEKNVMFVENLVDGVLGETGMSQPDIIHPNARGIEKMVDNVLDDVKDALDALN